MRKVVESTPKAQTKAERTKAHLIAVAKRLMQANGVDRVSLRDIATAAKMKAGSIYYHFASRDEIIRAVLASGTGGATQAVTEAIARAGPGSSPLERLRAALQAHLAYTVQEHFSSRIGPIRHLPRRLREQHMKEERAYAAIFADLLREANETGLLRPGFNLSVTLMLAMGALTWVAEWYDPDGPMTLDDVADEFMRLFGGGVIKAGRR
jgi:AcrR family transcriptional regulator